jgi:hypothetical protein
MTAPISIDDPLCRSACFGAKVWKVADPWDTCLVPADLASIMVGGGECPHAGLPNPSLEPHFSNNISRTDSASVAGCAAAMISGIVDGDGDADDSPDDIERLADAGMAVMGHNV